jgi:hypothetical protein
VYWIIFVNIFPKTEFTWREAKAFPSGEPGQVRTKNLWLRRPLYAGFVFFVFFFNLCGVLLIPSKNPPSFQKVLSACAFASVVVVYIVPWFFRKLPSRISISDKMITRTTGPHWFFKDITSFSLTTAAECSTLILNHRGGKTMSIEVPIGPLSEFLSQRIPSQA